jgi:acyl carrier protein
MTVQALVEQIGAFLQERDPGMQLAGVDADTDLIDAGILDSMLVTDLILFLEGQTGRSIPLADLSIDAIKTVRGLHRLYVLEKSA